MADPFLMSIKDLGQKFALDMIYTVQRAAWHVRGQVNP